MNKEIEISPRQIAKAITDLLNEKKQLEQENKELQEENNYLKLNNPEQNIEHFRIIKENKRKIDNLRKENKILRENAKNNDKVKRFTK